MQVGLGGAVPVIHPQGPGHARQGGQQGAIDGGQPLKRLRLLAGDRWHGLAGQLDEEAPQQGGIEDAGRGAEGAEGGAGLPKLF